jgi:hypothetical protein
VTTIGTLLMTEFDRLTEEIRRDDPGFEPTNLDRAIDVFARRLYAAGKFQEAGDIAQAGSLLHYVPLTSDLHETGLRQLYDALSTMIMAAATIANEINESMERVTDILGADDPTKEIKLNPADE